MQQAFVICSQRVVMCEGGREITSSLAGNKLDSVNQGYFNKGCCTGDDL